MSSPVTAKFEDIYPLTPFQQGVLFHVLDTPAAGMYLNQQRYTLRGELDLAVFKQALQAVVDRHPILRTAFLLAGLDGPHQVVYRTVKLPWVMYDWSELPPEEASQRFQTFLRSDFRSGFDLKRVPLNRMTLIRMQRDAYEFVWSFHLLLMDGWSMQVILSDLLRLYESFRTGQPIKLEPPLPYREFIKWQQRQPQDEAEAYWRKRLKGFSRPTALVFDKTPPTDFDEQPDFREKIAVVDEAATNKLRAFAQRHRITLSMLIQGAWALLLSRRSGSSDVLFGNAVSGRSGVIPRIDTAVGLFVNVLPVRVLVPPDAQVVPWLRDLQQQEAKERSFEFCSLVSMHRWSDVPRDLPLFESVIVFQNYPRGVAVPKSAAIELVNVEVIERSHLPLALVPHPGSPMELKIVYMGSRFEDATIYRIMENLQRILLELTVDADAPLSSISYQADTERRFLIDSFNQSLASV
jgi:Condensation domain